MLCYAMNSVPHTLTKQLFCDSCALNIAELQSYIICVTPWGKRYIS